MSLQSGSATFSRFTVAPPEGDPRRWLGRGLTRGAFEPLDLQRSEEDRAAGFVEREETDSTRFALGAVTLGEWALFAWRVDAVKVPAASIKAGLSRWEAAFTAKGGRPPARAERAAARETIRRELRLRTPVVTRSFDLSWNLSTGELFAWVASRKVVDEIAAAIETAFGAKLTPRSPAALAAGAGADLDALAPTAALVGAPTGREAVR